MLFQKIFDKSRTYQTCFIQDLNKAATDLRFRVSLVREMVGGEGRRVSKREGRIRRKFRVSKHRFGKPDCFRIDVGEASVDETRRKRKRKTYWDKFGLIR